MQDVTDDQIVDAILNGKPDPAVDRIIDSLIGDAEQTRRSEAREGASDL